jgi:hypothetical protein
MLDLKPAKFVGGKGFEVRPEYPGYDFNKIPTNGVNNEPI